MFLLLFVCCAQDNGTDVSHTVDLGSSFLTAVQSAAAHWILDSVVLLLLLLLHIVDYGVASGSARRSW